MRTRWIASGLVVALMAPLPAVRAQEEGWRGEIGALLADRARAVMRGDEVGFRATMRFAPRRYAAASLRSMRRLHALGLATYELRLGEEYADLSAGLDHPPDGDEVRVVQVRQHVALKGFDDSPAVDDLYLTVVRRGSRWGVTSDADLEAIGLQSARAVWDFTDVERVERGPVLVLHAGRRAVAERLASEVTEAVAYVRQRWPYRWSGRAVVVMPRSTADLSRILRTSDDLSPFVAFVTSSQHRPRGRYVLGGHRLYVQPETFFGQPASYRRDTLSHEVLHLATREITGAFMPAWLDEGVAQLYGERAAVPTAELRDTLRSGRITGLPEDHLFATGGKSAIKGAYQASASFLLELRRRYGVDAPARLYRAVGERKPDSFGTARYHLDSAAREVTERSLRDLERTWFDTVRRELAA